MSLTLPRRLCMGVTMGPALTEAATQAIKLPETTPASSDAVSTGRQTDDQTKKENQTVIQSRNSSKCLKPSGIDASPVSRISGNSLRAVDKQSSTFRKLQGVVNTISGPKQIKNIVIHKGVLLQNLGTTNINATSLLSGKVCGKTGIMNQPSTAVDKDSAKHGGHAVKNRSHTHGEIRGSGKASTASQLGYGSHLYVQRSGGNLYSAATSQTRPASQIATNASNVHGKRNMNNRLVKCISASRAPDTKEPTSEGHEVDRTVTEQCVEASKKQAQLERRLEFMYRRGRRIEARQVEQHTRQELSSFASHQRQNLQTVSKSVNKSGLGCQSGGDDLNKELLSDGARHMSTAALVSLVHKMQKQGAASQLPVMVKPEVTTILNMSHDERKDSIEAASKMVMDLNMMQSALDSDATESSSGGETDGEDGQDAHCPLPATPLLRRAEWKWASDRSSIASDWTWLQAQVSDLEYRIRQQTELYRQSRGSKGPVVLAEPPLPQTSTVPAIQTSVSSHDGRTSVQSSVVSQGSRQMLPSGDMQSNQTSQSANKCSATVTGSISLLSSGSSHSTAGVRSHEMTCNRVTSMPPNAHRRDAEDSYMDLSTSSSMDLDPAVDPTCRAARCFPLKHPLRKRKLVRTSALEMKSVKVAKLSTVKCQCHPTMTPCVLCCRKEKSLQKVDPHYMSFQERVSLMDSSFHPVLSFREEVPLSVHYEGLLRSGEWQNKAPVRRQRAEQGQRAQKHKLPSLSEGRKALLRKSQSSVIIQSAKIRNKYEQKASRKLSTSQGLAALGNRTLSTDHKGLTHAPFGVGRGRGRRRRGQGTRGRGYMRRGLNVPLSHEAGFLKEKEVRRRRGESAYDINSIVIPRSMAALTRVEKLEYKEIPIPSWRHTKETEAEADAVKTNAPDPKSNGLIAMDTSGNEEIEDLSDESYVQRHIICEMAEKKRFSSAIRLPHSRRRVRAVAQPRVSTASLPDATQSSFPSTPPAMGTQISMDSEDFGMDESDSRFSELWGSSRPQSPATVVGSTPPIGIPGRAAKDGSATSRLGCAPLPQEPESVTPNPDYPEQSQTTFWQLRQFPLTDEEVSQLEKEDQRIHEEKALPPQPSAVPRIPNLRPQPVETGSQAGSSVCSSLPPSPLPSTSSASVGEDWDMADTEWTLDTDMVKKKGGRTKATKR